MNATNPECEAVRSEFSALLDDELSAAERDRIEGHLADCAECLRVLNRLKRVDDAYAGLPAASAPAGFEDAVRRRLEPPQVRRFPRRPVIGALLAAAAAVLIVVAVWPRTAVAPGNGAFQLSRSADVVDDAAPTASAPQPALLEEEPADAASEVTAQSAPASADESRDDAPRAPAPESDMDMPALGRSLTIAGSGERGPEPAQAAPFEPVPTDDFRDAPESEPVVVMRRRFTGDTVRREIPREQLEYDPSAVAKAAESAEGTEQPARTFEVRDGVWYQTGYDGEETITIPRNSPLLEQIVEGDPTVAELVENESEIVFTVNGRWYRLPAEPREQP